MADRASLLKMTLPFLLYVNKALLRPALDCIAFFFDNSDIKVAVGTSARTPTLDVRQQMSFA